MAHWSYYVHYFTHITFFVIQTQNLPIYFLFIVFLERGSFYVAQFGLKVTMLTSPVSESWQASCFRPTVLRFKVEAPNLNLEFCFSTFGWIYLLSFYQMYNRVLFTVVIKSYSWFLNSFIVSKFGSISINILQISKDCILELYFCVLNKVD